MSQLWDRQFFILFVSDFVFRISCFLSMWYSLLDFTNFFIIDSEKELLAIFVAALSIDVLYFPFTLNNVVAGRKFGCVTLTTVKKQANFFNEFNLARSGREIIGCVMDSRPNFQKNSTINLANCGRIVGWTLFRDKINNKIASAPENSSVVASLVLLLLLVRITLR